MTLLDSPGPPRDIGAIHLNLLGLVIDLAPIHLNITAIQGGGLL